MSLNLIESLQFDVDSPTLRNETRGEHEAASSVAKAPSRADSESEKDEPTEGATTARRKAETIDEPSLVRCYDHRCNGRCLLGSDAGSNAAGLHGDTHAVMELRVHKRRSARSRREPDLSPELTCSTLLRASSC